MGNMVGWTFPWWSRPSIPLNDEEVNFNHFVILRAIGKGSFGKVCMVQKHGTEDLYAMKYVGRDTMTEATDVLEGVCKEVRLLSTLEHPFLVNLWYTFQDEEDLFMVSDLLGGGDLRYHLKKQVRFNEESTTLFLCELATALDYLQTKRIVHRDIKPDNILLNEKGHAHLTDFNIATELKDNDLSTSMSGTKPYMAPEIFACAANVCPGYSFPVDWWSLGVVGYELLCGVRPFDIHSINSISEVRQTLSVKPEYPPEWSIGMVDLLTKLLNVNAEKRISNLDQLKKVEFLQSVDFDLVLSKNIQPLFIPSENHLNCDPMFELEEMILEAKPLHKKKKRLAKQRSSQEMETEIPKVKGFLVYNRCKELQKREQEKREKEWENELKEAMESSDQEHLKPSESKPSSSPCRKVFTENKDLSVISEENRKADSKDEESESPEDDSNNTGTIFTKFERKNMKKDKIKIDFTKSLDSASGSSQFSKLGVRKKEDAKPKENIISNMFGKTGYNTFISGKVDTTPKKYKNEEELSKSVGKRYAKSDEFQLKEEKPRNFGIDCDLLYIDDALSNSSLKSGDKSISIDYIDRTPSPT